MTMATVREIPNYTPEQVEQHLSDALELVERLAPSDDLRVAVFGKAVDLLSGKRVEVIQPATFAPPLLGNGGGPGL